MSDINEKLKQIRCFITDIDGVLTNGFIYLSDSGEQMKAFHVHDGFGLRLLQHADITVAAITLSTSSLIDIRMQQLGITHYYKGQLDKVQAFNDLLDKLSLTANEVLYIGDDLPDLPLLKQCGFSATVNDARPQIKEAVDYVCEASGGRGAIRELCDLLIKAKGLETAVLERLYSGKH